MRYAKGYLNLNRREDKFILQFVADSRYITRSQLFNFARLDYGESNPQDRRVLFAHQTAFDHPADSPVEYRQEPAWPCQSSVAAPSPSLFHL